MKSFSVNGIEKEIPLEAPRTLPEFMEYVKKTFTSDSEMISCVKVDGEELSEESEAELGSVPIEELRALEVITIHPREFVQDTIQTLVAFTHQLEGKSRAAGAAALGADRGKRELSDLVEGVTTFTEALKGVKRILRLGFYQPIAVLEADLYSILKDLADFQAGEHWEFVADLLCDHLPANFAEWRTKGLPALSRARDS
jgi:hypothetical protein